jgi:hypothetical protein
MNTPNAHEGFCSQLVRRGLPVEYADRAAAELADHHRDLVAELHAEGRDEAAAAAEASRRLGDQRTLVKKTVREYQRRHWCGRWPLLTFTFGPIVFALVSFVAIVMLAYCVFVPLEQLGIRFDQTSDGIISPREYALAFVGHLLSIFAPLAISMLMLARLARKAAMGSVWFGLSTSILTVIATSIWYGFAGDVFPNRPADQAVLMAGLPLFQISPDPMYIAQCLLPLGIGVAMMLRMRRLSRRSELSLLEDHTQGGIHEFAKCA